MSYPELMDSLVRAHLTPEEVAEIDASVETRSWEQPWERATRVQNAVWDVARFIQDNRDSLITYLGLGVSESGGMGLSLTVPRKIREIKDARAFLSDALAKHIEDAYPSDEPQPTWLPGAVADMNAWINGGNYRLYKLMTSVESAVMDTARDNTLDMLLGQCSGTSVKKAAEDAFEKFFSKAQ